MKLALGLRLRGFYDPQLDQVLKDAEHGALPEVRFAASESQDQG